MCILGAPFCVPAQAVRGCVGACKPAQDTMGVNSEPCAYFTRSVGSATFSTSGVQQGLYVRQAIVWPDHEAAGPQNHNTSWLLRA